MKLYEPTSRGAEIKVSFKRKYRIYTVSSLFTSFILYIYFDWIVLVEEDDDLP